MADDARREISLTRTAAGTYEVTNARGGTLTLGTGQGTDFTPVEALLAAIAGCSAVDVDALTSRLSEPTEFTATASGSKVREEDGSRMTDLEVTFTVRFGEGEDADRARDRLPDAVRRSHERLCTVSRTVELPSPVTFHVTD